MACSRCGADRTFQFQADPLASKRAVHEADLPLVCRSCGQITVNGVALQFPAAFEANAKDLADAAAKAAEETRIELANDPDARILRYFTKIYREAYLDGFLRCLAFYQHNAKEGKLKRLRELWQTIQTTVASEDGMPQTVYARFQASAFDEFSQLMLLGAVPD